MNRIVLITGASSGYGKATAKAFKDAGDTVIMTARNEEKLEAARREVGGDLAFKTSVTVCDSDVVSVKRSKKIFTPNSGYKISDCHNVFSFLFLK